MQECTAPATAVRIQARYCESRAGSLHFPSFQPQGFILARTIHYVTGLSEIRWQSSVQSLWRRGFTSHHCGTCSGGPHSPLTRTNRDRTPGEIAHDNILEFEEFNVATILGAPWVLRMNQLGVVFKRESYSPYN